MSEDLSDWLVVKNDKTKKLKSNSSPDLSDWQLSDSNQEESFLKKLPRNIGIGLVHAGRGLHNLPHDLAHGVDVVGSSIGRALGAPELQNKNSNIASYLPYDEQNYAQLLGQKGQGSTIDNLIQKGIEYAPDIIGGANALRGLKLLPHLTRKGASNALRKAADLSKTRNIGALSVDPNLVEDAAQFLPKTSAYRKTLEGAGYGDFNSLFKLQSDLGKHASDYAKSLFSASERAHGRAGMATRNKLLQEIHKGLQEQGHHDISNLLNKGQNEYRRYMKFKPYRNILGGAAIAAALPKNALVNVASKILSHKTQ